MMIQTVFWKNNKVVMIDQKALPLNRRQLVCSDYRQVITAIKDLTVRGAPAIGVAAAMSAALGALSIPSEPVAQFRKKFHAVCNEIEKSRPTAKIFSGPLKG